MKQESMNEPDIDNKQTDAEMNSSIKWIAIREDDLKTIEEIGDRLDVEKIPYQINLAQGCKKGSCSLTYLLLVAENNTQSALLVIENYFIELHPEFQISKDLEEQGKCPACSFDNGHNAKTCADCGLQLIIE